MSTKYGFIIHVDEDVQYDQYRTNSATWDKLRIVPDRLLGFAVGGKKADLIGRLVSYHRLGAVTG